VRLQQTVDDREQAGMLDEQRERGILREERVDTLGVEALEVVAPHVLALEVGRERGAHRGNLLGREHVLQHDEALAPNGARMRDGLGIGPQLARGRHRCVDGIRIRHAAALACGETCGDGVLRVERPGFRASVVYANAAAAVIASNSRRPRDERSLHVATLNSIPSTTPTPTTETLTSNILGLRRPSARCNHHDGHIDHRDGIDQTYDDQGGDETMDPAPCAGHRRGGTGLSRGTHRGTARQYVS
jgi:hypothetical protein